MNEKESVEARDRRILEFPLSMSPKEVAKALKAEGCYSPGTTVYYIEYRVRRLRGRAQREDSFMPSVSLTEHLSYNKDKYGSPNAPTQE